MTIPLDKISTYREHLRQRLSRPLTKSELAELQKARAEAEQAAYWLAKEKGARKIILFGSVARGWPLRHESDIDLAVEGMPAQDYFEIVGDMTTQSGRSIDLIRLEAVSGAFRNVILAEGIVLVHEH